MPKNKNAVIRYHVLDRCFRNTGRSYYIEDLIDEINKVLMDIDPNLTVSKRQVLDDIRFMESSEGWSADIDRLKDGRRVYYRYTDPSFSINNVPLRQDEINKINAAIGVLRRFEGMPQFDWVYEIIPLLQEKLGLITAMDKPAVGFDFNPDLKGLEFLGTLFNAILNRVVLRVTYKRFGDESANVFHYHPYYLKEYNNRWFAIGLNHNEQVVNWVIALDRIEQIEETSTPYEENDTDWQEYFYDLVGVTRPSDVKPENITLLFSKQRAPYVVTKPLHASQRHRFVNDELEVRLKVIPNNELLALLLSFCPDIEVIEPKWLRKKFAALLNQALQKNRN